MTPPCPNCGTVYHESPSPSGWRVASITDTPIFDGTGDASAFCGHEYYCRKCLHRWRVEARPDANGPA